MKEWQKSVWPFKMLPTVTDIGCTKSDSEPNNDPTGFAVYLVELVTTNRVWACHASNLGPI